MRGARRAAAIVNGAIGMCLNSSGLAIPIGANCVPAGTVTPSNTSAAPLYVAGNESGTAPVQTATPANASHTAGQSVGGLFTIPMLRVAGGGGLLEYIPIMLVGGDPAPLQVSVWDRKPTNSNFACTDNSAYDGSGSTGGTVGADQSHMLPGFPQSVTLAVPAQTTGDAKSYGRSRCHRRSPSRTRTARLRSTCTSASRRLRPTRPAARRTTSTRSDRRTNPMPFSSHPLRLFLAALAIVGGVWGAEGADEAGVTLFGGGCGATYCLREWRNKNHRQYSNIRNRTKCWHTLQRRSLSRADYRYRQQYKSIWLW